MNLFFICIGVKPTVFQLLYGLQTILLAMDSSKYANNTRNTESVKSRTIFSNLLLTQTSGTQKILPKLDDLGNLFIDQQQLESLFYQVLVIFDNSGTERKDSGNYSKIK